VGELRAALEERRSAAEGDGGDDHGTPPRLALAGAACGGGGGAAAPPPRLTLVGRCAEAQPLRRRSVVTPARRRCRHFGACLCDLAVMAATFSARKKI